MICISVKFARTVIYTSWEYYELTETEVDTLNRGLWFQSSSWYKILCRVSGGAHCSRGKQCHSKRECRWCGKPTCHGRKWPQGGVLAHAPLPVPKSVWQRSSAVAATGTDAENLKLLLIICNCKSLVPPPLTHSLAKLLALQSMSSPLPTIYSPRTDQHFTLIGQTKSTI